MNMFHRRYGGKRSVVVTFYGNGGMTAEGESVVELAVRRGSEWKDIAHPAFFQGGMAKEQNGFTMVQGDDNTAVAPDYVVDSDMTVYASYSLIEVGFITRRGEVMSAQGWINKYGLNCYEVDPEYPDSLRIKDSMRDNLICYFYCKASNERAFAASSEYRGEDGAMYGMDWNLYIGDGSFDAVDWSDKLNLFDTRRYGSIGTSIDTTIYPFVHNPPSFTEPGVPPGFFDSFADMMDGREYSRIIYNNYPSSPLFQRCAAMSAGDVLPAGSFYLASTGETILLIRNGRRIWDVVEVLDNWAASVGLYSHVDACYRIAGDTISPHGFVRYKRTLVPDGNVGNTTILQTSALGSVGIYSGEGSSSNRIWARFARIEANANSVMPSIDYAISVANPNTQEYKYILADVNHLF